MHMFSHLLVLIELKKKSGVLDINVVNVQHNQAYLGCSVLAITIDVLRRVVIAEMRKPSNEAFEKCTESCNINYPLSLCPRSPGSHRSGMSLHYKRTAINVALRPRASNHWNRWPFYTWPTFISNTIVIVRCEMLSSRLEHNCCTHTSRWTMMPKGLLNAACKPLSMGHLDYAHTYSLATVHNRLTDALARARLR